MTAARKDGSSGRSTGLIVLIIFIVFLILAEAALVTIAFVSPDTARTLAGEADRLSEAWRDTEEGPGIPTRISRAADRFYETEVVTLWQLPDGGDIAPTFARCGTCHAGYESKARFTHVYMDHTVHAEEGLECQRCHTSVEHPNPERPAEEVCEQCHNQVNEKGGCDYCHPVGSLPHFFLMGAPRQGFLDCATCHPTNLLSELGERLVHVGDFSGDPDTRCMKCHPKAGHDQVNTGQPVTCNGCHGEPHPADWIKTHPEPALASQVCFNCHAATYCAQKCHAVSTLGSPPLLPLPSPSEVITP